MSRPTYVSMTNPGGFDVDDEKALLEFLAVEGMFSSEYLLAEKVEVKPLQRKHVRRAARTMVDAIENDPLEIYSRETPDARNPRLYKRTVRLGMTIGLLQTIERKLALTVNHGRSMIFGIPAPESSKRSKLDRKIDDVYRLIIRIVDHIGRTKMQRRRTKEISKKIDRFVRDTLGADMQRMRCVSGLATAPEFQRRGYGGALLDAVTKLADAEGRSTYLLSSNPAANDEFYNSHGFFTIAELLIGEDDPTWNGPPIPIPLMVRIYGDQ